MEGFLINKQLAKEYGFKTNKNNITWDDNNETFKSGKMDVVNNLWFPYFTNKKDRLIIFRINPNL